MNNMDLMNYRRLVLIAQEINDMIGKKKLDIKGIVKLFEGTHDFLVVYKKEWKNPLVHVVYKSYDGHKYSIALARYKNGYHIFSPMSMIDDEVISLDYVRCKVYN